MFQILTLLPHGIALGVGLLHGGEHLLGFSQLFFFFRYLVLQRGKRRFRLPQIGDYIFQRINFLNKIGFCFPVFIQLVFLGLKRCPVL